MSNAEKRVGQIVLGWWRERINANTGSAKAGRAILRRAFSPTEALAVEAVHVLAGKLSEAGYEIKGKNAAQRLALLATTLAHVKEDHKDRPLAEAFGRGDPRPLSELRFQRLIREEDPARLAVALRRALPLVGRVCNVARLAEDLFWWNDDTRNRWCFEYFGAAIPEDIDPSRTEEPVS